MKPFTGTERILLMDDEEDIRQTTGDMLKRLGYTAEFAGDELRTIDLYQRRGRQEHPLMP
jgi:CheY-like chemotaxis protein